MSDSKPDCSSRHLEWGAIIVSIVLAVCAATVGFAFTQTSSIESRLQKIELTAVRLEERLINVQEKLK